MDEAIKQIEEAVKLDPVSIPANRLRIEIYSRMGRYEEVCDLGTRHLDLDPNDMVAGATIAHAYAQESQPEKARDILKLYANRDDVPFMGSMTQAQKLLGMKTELQSTLDSLLQRSETEYIPAYSIGILYAGLDRYEEAIVMFQESHEKNEPLTVLKARHVLLEPIFDDPRIQKIFLDLDLPMP